MVQESEPEFATSFFRCIDPIENFRIKVILKPVKNVFIPLPKFEKEGLQDSSIPFVEDREEYIFKWQEKIFSEKEVKMYLKDPAFKEKYHMKHYKNLSNQVNNKKSCPKKLFSYIEDDNYLFEAFTSNNITCKPKDKIKQLNSNYSKLLKPDVTSKGKVIKYGPNHSHKSLNYAVKNKYIQNMAIMIDLGLNNEKEGEENYVAICALRYNTVNKLLEITPSFTESNSKPYLVEINNNDNKNSYFYWLVHASSTISTVNLRKEIKIMSKLFDHQEDLKQMLVGRDFFIGKPNHLYVTMLGNIISAEGFEYNKLFINYFVKLPIGWQSNSSDLFFGVTQTCSPNSNGKAHFCHLFEMDFFKEIQPFEGSSLSSPELIFEVLSIDHFGRYHTEGYTYISLPENPGMYNFCLRCWKPVGTSIKAQLKNFFIGAEPDLENIYYVGLSNMAKAQLINRFGFETQPSGKLNLDLNIIHQSDILKKTSKANERFNERTIYKIPDPNALLSSINKVLEAFRKARIRMLETKRNLEYSELVTS